MVLSFDVLLSGVEDLICLNFKFTNFLVFNEVLKLRSRKLIDNEVSIRLIFNEYLSLIFLTKIAPFCVICLDTDARLVNGF